MEPIRWRVANGAVQKVTEPALTQAVLRGELKGTPGRE
jgi:hypothetical protein